MNLRRIDDLCDDFEAALRQGEPVRIEDYVDQVPEELREKLLRELLEIEIEYTGTRNPEEDPQAEWQAEPAIFRLQKSLKDRFPEQNDLVDSAVRRVAKLRQIGDYEILEELGHGGMGIVYKARQKLLNQTVAIKVLSQRLLDDPQAVGRFRREMQLIGGLNHPNIVRALNAGMSDTGSDTETGEGMHYGTHYLVMEFVDGVTLQRLCDLIRRAEPENPPVDSQNAPTVRHDSFNREEAKKPAPSVHGTAIAEGPVMPIGAACEAIRQAALGLEHAHHYGLVHRDIKPANLMLDRTGTVKLLDLGLGKFLEERRISDDEASLTVAGTTIGTIDYISPEQCENAGDADIRADIYSLGCTLYFLVTGKAPYSGSRYDTTRKKLMAHIVGEVPKLDKVLPDVPEELEAVLEKMLAKEPGERFQTPLEVAEAIAPFASFEELHELIGADALPSGVLRRTPGSTSRMIGTSNTLQTKAASRRPAYMPKSARDLWTIMLAPLIVGIVVLMLLPGIYVLRNIVHRAGNVEQNIDDFKQNVTTAAIDEKKATVQTDLALLPGLYGGWWFEETPWFLPAVREILLREIETAQDLKPLLGEEPEKYFDTNIPAVQDWIRQIVQKHLPPQKRELVEKLYAFQDSNDAEEDDGKALEEILNLLTVAKTETAADLHGRAVLEHRLAVIRNDKELAVKASEHYAEARNRYRNEIRQAEEEGKPVKHITLLELLCRSDAARLEYLATGSYRKAIEKFEDVRTHLRSFEHRSQLFQAEFHAAFGALCAEAGQYQDNVFVWNIDSLKRSRLGKGMHPLLAQLAERYAWSLLDQWKVIEAEKQFKEAVFIRAANQRESGSRFAMTYVWHDLHALAMTFRYLGNPRQAIEEYRNTLESIDKQLEACRTEMKSNSPPSGNGLRHYYAKVRDRAANTRERLADCTLYGGAASGVSSSRLREMARLYGEAAKLYEIEGTVRTMKAKQAVALLLANDSAGAEEILHELDEQKRHLLGNQTRTDLVRQVADALLTYRKSMAENKPEAAKIPLHQFLEQFSIPSNPIFGDATRRENLELRIFCAEFLVDEASSAGDLRALASDLAWLVQPMGFFQDRPESRPFLYRINETIIRCYAVLYENQPENSPSRQTYLRAIVRLLEWMRLRESLQESPESAASALAVFFLTEDPKDGFVVFYPLDVARKGEFFRLPMTRKDVKTGSRRQDGKWKLDEKLLQLIKTERKDDRRVAISWDDEACWRRSEDALTDADWPFGELKE